MGSVRRALIVGITGQDGSYLADFLLGRGYDVYGLVRPPSTGTGIPWRISHAADRVTLLTADLLEVRSLVAALEAVAPHELYNLAGTSFVPDSARRPLASADETALSVVRLLEAICATDPAIRFYQASSSELFGHADRAPQDEMTRFVPRNLYGVNKLFGHLMVEQYRERFGVFGACGILYNHESPRRGLEFVTRKITSAAARIAFGVSDELLLGDVSARRDWGFAGDYVHAMWLMLQQANPQTYVIATGELHSVEDVLDIAFERVHLDWRQYVFVDPTLFRPSDGESVLVGDSTRAHLELGWQPTITFEALIELMVDADLARLRAGGERSGEADWPSGSRLLQPAGAPR